MRRICDVLSARKNELDISIDDIADKSGVPRSTVAKIISGATPDPQYQRLSAIVGALDLTMDEFSALMSDDEAGSQQNYGDLSLFQNRLKKARKEYGISQTELARRLNVSASTIARYEIGNGTPNMEMLCRMADVLHVDLKELMQGRNCNTALAAVDMSPEAQALAADFDRLDERGRSIVRAVVYAELDYMDRQGNTGNVAISEDDRKRLSALAEQVRADADRRKNRARQDALPGDAG